MKRTTALAGSLFWLLAQGLFLIPGCHTVPRDQADPPIKKTTIRATPEPISYPEWLKRELAERHKKIEKEEAEKAGGTAWSALEKN